MRKNYKSFSKILSVFTIFNLIFSQMIMVGIFIFPQPTLAASVGPNNGSKFNNDSMVGTVAWTKIEKAKSDGGDEAEVELNDNEISYYLKATDFGFTLSSESIITGIEVQVKGKAEKENLIKDYSVRIVKNGVISGDEKAKTNVFWGKSYPTTTYTTYGSENDLWGLSWTPEDINNSNFGFVLSVKKDSTDRNKIKVMVDHIRIKVYYTLASASLTVIKETIGGNGTFYMTGSGGIGSFSISTYNGIGTQTFNNLTPGSYSITETVPEGWEIKTNTCQNVQVGIGQNATCMITNTKKSKVTIRKETIPEDSVTDFLFKADYIGEFNLKNNESKSSYIEPGNRNVIEEVPKGWYLTNIVCQDSDSGTTVNLSQKTASLDVDVGEEIMCTFTNTKLGSITVKKESNPEEDIDFVFNLINLNNNGPTPKGSISIRGSGEGIFGNLLPGEYNLIEDIEDLPENWSVESVKCDDDDSQNPSNLILDPGENITCVFNNTKYGIITGRKIHDLNANGKEEEGEPALEGWKIILKNTKGEELATTNTDERGWYIFSSLLPGTYEVCEEEKDNWFVSFPGGGDCCYTVDIKAGEIKSGINFGNYQYGAISGYKYEDLNGNGQLDNGEKAITYNDISGGVTIFIDLSSEPGQNEGDPRTISDESGAYYFNNLIPGNYLVCERDDLLSDWVRTFPKESNCQEVTVISGQSTGNINFGNFKLAKISGYKWYDINNNSEFDKEESPLENWDIIATNGELTKTTSTNKDGYYEFTFGPSDLGDWTISEVLKENWKQTFPVENGNYNVTISSSGENKSEKNFGNIRYYENLSIKLAPSNGDFTSTTQLFILGDSIINVPVQGGTSTILLLDGTVITREDGGSLDGNSLIATSTDIGSLSGLGTGVVVDGALKWGIENLGLNFNPYITIKIFVGANFNGQTLNILRSISGNSGWTNNGIVSPATCVVTDGYCTFQTTKASYYVATHTVSGGGARSGDSYSLVILPGSVVISKIRENSVTIRWTTSQQSTSQVIYSRSDQPHTLDLNSINYGYAYSKEGDDSGLEKITDHSVTINGLTPGTTYYYRTISRNPLIISQEYAFTTQGVAGVTKVVEEFISSQPEIERTQLRGETIEIPSLSEETQSEKQTERIIENPEEFIQENVVSPKGVVLPSEGKIPRKNLTSLLLATLGEIGKKSWMVILVTLCIIGLVVIGIRGLQLIIKKKKSKF